MNTGKDPLLWLVRQRYGERWTIRRTEHLWIATAVDPDPDHAPTLVEPDVEVFVQQLEDPPARVGRSHSLLAAPWFAQRLTELAEGAYREDRP
ncbi:hypothetical protein F4561_005143 [Lipingzhangella halophila]|uniref:Uncharacterized protein n=1 Tax=Lipingzhangella halophila TaxID=1783352 RepID=A0A7W7RLR1_9ACTN|nr:hypothetical protein [Lipingzhangella halophila]MBB4934323.1 hypothetical protein [Lipingzhangella halophila]